VNRDDAVEPNRSAAFNRMIALGAEVSAATLFDKTSGRGCPMTAMGHEEKGRYPG
jgi:hypothetical protein